MAISEGAIVGTRKLLEPSILPGRNLDSPFSIIDGNHGSYFQLHVTKSQDGRRVAYIHLETRKKLDRELTPYFDLNITNGLQGYLDLRVRILDINDNPPVFQQSDYEVNVNESVPVGTSLVTVIANDADEGKNAQLSYFMANADAGMAADKVFHIDSQTGLLSVKQSLKISQLPCLKQSKVRCPAYTNCKQTAVIFSKRTQSAFVFSNKCKVTHFSRYLSIIFFSKCKQTVDTLLPNVCWTYEPFQGMFIDHCCYGWRTTKTKCSNCSQSGSFGYQ